MSAPLGNQFWKNRSKHGRDALFATASVLWDAACEYFQWCDENPWYRTDFKGKDADRVEIPTARPYTLSGFTLHCDVSESYFRVFKQTASEDFLTVIARIEQVIYTQKYEGAVVGAFNANIISRDLGLADKVQVTTAEGATLKAWTADDVQAYEAWQKLQKGGDDARD